jgi:rSAM/selenodomain-associated transferase 1/alkylhydroperoxidase/carboxymuconolactone decarboxylase family protein
MGRRALIVFAKEPRPGFVKTRLGRTIGMERAARIYRECAESVFRRARAEEESGVSVTLCYDPDSRPEELRRWVDRPSFQLIPQEGASLGERMHGAFRRAMEAGADRVLLVGSDVPELDGDILAEAWRSLERHDVVLGPSEDGGYYLIGMRAPPKDLFDQIQWSTPTVYDETLRRAAAQGVSVWALPVRADIDREEDVLAYEERLRTHGSGGKIISEKDDRPMAPYYESKDLAKFPEMGKNQPQLWEKFLAWYTEATAVEGALTKREKSLVGLAVAHTVQCPYCIDAYTTQCLETGANLDQMTEAIHVASAVRGGASLVHGVQCRNIVEKLSL